MYIPDFSREILGPLQISPSLLIRMGHLQYLITVIILMRRLLNGDRFILLYQGSVPFPIILDFKDFQKINPIFRLNVAATPLLVIVDIMHRRGETIPEILMYCLLCEWFVPISTIILMVLLTLISGGREVLRELNNFTHAFSIL